MARGKHSKKRPTSTQEPSGLLRVTVSFAQVVCSRCGDRRIATHNCPTCGENPKPGEYDVKAQRRRRAAEALRQVAAEPPSSAFSERPSGDELAPLLGRLRTVPSGLFELLGSVDRGGDCEKDAVDSLIVLYRMLRSDQQKAHKTWLRPWRRHGRLAAELTDSVVAAFDAFVTAFAAADVHTTVQHVEAGQRGLDETARRAKELGERVDFLEACLNSQDELDLVSLCFARELDRLTPAAPGLASLMAVERAGRARLPFLSDAHQDGRGLQAQLLLLVTDCMLDPVQLITVAEHAHAALDEVRFVELTADPFWAERQQAAARTIFDACRDLADLASTTASSTRRGTRAQLAFIQDLVEGAVRHYLATLLACTSTATPASNAYVAARGGSGSGPVTAAQGILDTSLTEGILVAARHASAHMDYTLDETHVMLQASKPAKAERLSFEELTDAVLNALETSLAMALAFSAMAEATGSPDEDETLLQELHPDLLPTVLLSASGWRDMSIARDGDTITVSGRASATLPITSIGMLLTGLDDGMRRLVLVVEENGQTRRFEAECDAFRRHKQRGPGDDNDEMLSLTSALTHVTVDGEPFISRDMVRHFIAVLAGQKLNAPLATAVPWLNRLASWAEEHDDAALGNVLRRVQGALRGFSFQLPVSPPEQAALDLLAKWESSSAQLPTHW